ncbi:MAG: glycosyltransferase family 4 protein [Acidimicrobiia bacterium]
MERYISSVTPLLVKAGFEVVAIGGDPTRMGRELTGSGVLVVPAVSTLDVLRQLRRSGPFDIVHSHMSAADLATVIATVGARTRIVTTRHFASTRGSTRPARLAFQALRLRIDRQLAISEYVARRVEGASTVLHSAVENLPLSEARDRIVMMAQRLEPEKETQTALQAWAASGLGDDGWRLVIAGSGSERDRLTSMAMSLGVAGSVEFAGYTSDLTSLRDRAKLLLATTPIEAFGLSVAEAMAAGLPVIAAGGGAHLETVGAVTPETLFPPGDVEACAKLLRWLATDEAARAERSTLVRSYQQEHFSLDAHVAKLVEIYHEVLVG